MSDANTNAPRCAFCGTYDAYRYRGKIDWQKTADGADVCGADCKVKQEARSAEIARMSSAASTGRCA